MAIKSIVIVREVWDNRDLAGNVLDDSGAIKTDLVGTRFEPEDLNALEAALRLKDEQGGHVTAMAIGATRNVDVLRECLYRGTDEVMCIEADPQLLDTQAQAALVAAAVQKIGGGDLILSGVTVPEGANSLLGSHIAALMGLEQVSYVDSIESVGEGKVIAKRAIEMGYESIEVATPAVLTMGVALTEDDPRTPRSAKAMLKLKAKKAQIPTMAVEELDLDPAAAAATEAGVREAVPERVIESNEVDPEDESALQAMLDTVLKGE